MSAADPHTDDLADRLDEWAAGMEHMHAVGVGHSSVHLRAAAAELRRLRHRDAALTRLLDAVGDVAELERIDYRHADGCTCCTAGIDCAVSNRLLRIAAAVEDIDQEHER